jgi:amylosucrase
VSHAARAIDVARAALAAEERLDRELFELRVERYWPDLEDGLAEPYGNGWRLEPLLDVVAGELARAAAARPAPLRRLDQRRLLRPDWFQRPEMLGYVCYADRFAGTLAGVAERVGYLEELGVRYLHLMPLLKARQGANDGGYAVVDYLAVEPRLGTMADLEHLCGVLRERGISLCIDLVLNHTAAEHAWARAARVGDPERRACYWMFETREEPDAYERTLPEVFPDIAPGSFSWLPDAERWVWTTFHEYQWDLNWSNPRVFVELLHVLLALANRGVEVFRLDAVAFMWKRLGTDCQNQPEVHALLQALRACARIAAPAVAFKAEAIVSPDDLAAYLGLGRHHGRVSDLAYHNTLMVQTWSALATRDTRLMRRALRRFPAKPPTTAWGTYLRCHDDIGWAIADEDAEAVGWSGATHRSFLADYYAGAFPGSDARGTVFGANPATGDRRTSGTLASLVGLEAALEAGDDAHIERCVRRILVAHALILGCDGLPLLYMGDELALRNDRSYLDDPALRDDSRWLHRPWLDWRVAERRHEPGAIEQRVFEGLQRLAAVRARIPHLHAAIRAEVLDVADEAVLAVVRRHPIGPLVGVYNLADRPARLEREVVAGLGLAEAVDRINGEPLPAGDVELDPYVALWLTVADRED